MQFTKKWESTLNGYGMNPNGINPSLPPMTNDWADKAIYEGAGGVEILKLGVMSKGLDPVTVFGSEEAANTLFYSKIGIGPEEYAKESAEMGPAYVPGGAPTPSIDDDKGETPFGPRPEPLIYREARRIKSGWESEKPTLEECRAAMDDAHNSTNSPFYIPDVSVFLPGTAEFQIVLDYSKTLGGGVHIGGEPSQQ